MLAKRYLLFFTVLSTACIKTFAQEFNVYFGANLQSDYSYHYKTEDTYSSLGIFNDSQAVRQIVHSIRSSNILYKASPGISAGLNYRKKVGNRWTVVSGLGINTVKMNTTSNFSNNSTVIKSDTIAYASSLPTSLQTCDSTITIGSYEQKNPSYHMIQLEIPLLVRYDISPGKWSIGLGVRMSTPLHIVHKYYSGEFTTNVNEHNEVVCKIEYKDRKDKSGNGFRDLNLGLAADMEYWFRRLGVSIGAEQRFTNIFANTDSGNIFEARNYAKPMVSYLKLLYKL